MLLANLHERAHNAGEREHDEHGKGDKPETSAEEHANRDAHNERQNGKKDDCGAPESALLDLSIFFQRVKPPKT